jgi:hypothetical protein
MVSVTDALERERVAFEAAFERSKTIIRLGNVRLLNHVLDVAGAEWASEEELVNTLIEAAELFEAYAAADEATLRRAIALGTADVRPLTAPALH